MVSDADGGCMVRLFMVGDGCSLLMIAIHDNVGYNWCMMATNG